MADAQPQRSSLLPAQVVPDSVLVRQARAGDQQAFELLVSRYHGPLTSYIRSLLNDGDQVADVLQEVYLRLYLSLPTLLTNSSLRGWLFQVARNRCIDELRKRRRYTEIPFSTLLWDAGEQDLSLPETIPDPAPLPEEVVEQFAAPGSGFPVAKVSPDRPTTLSQATHLRRDRVPAQHAGDHGEDELLPRACALAQSAGW